MNKIIISSGLVAIASCVRIQGYIDMGANGNSIPFIAQKPMFNLKSTMPQGSIKVSPYAMSAQPMYTSTIPVAQTMSAQPMYTSTIPVDQAMSAQPMYTYNIPIQQPMTQMPYIQTIPDMQPAIQAPVIQSPYIQPSYIQAPMGSQYYNQLGALSVPQMPSINYAQQLYSQSGIQNLNSNMASTNNQNVAVNTSASGNSNASTNLTNNAISTGTGQITVPTNGLFA